MTVASRQANLRGSEERGIDGPLVNGCTPNLYRRSKGWPGSKAPNKANGANAQSTGADSSAVPIAAQIMQIAGDSRSQ
jgi:hypothetical protein